MDKVIWQEGMLLRPQHFQQHERYMHHQLQVRSQNQNRFNWGFYSLSIDLHHLSVGKVLINEAKGVLPDGTLFDINHQSKPLIWQATQEANGATLYLSLPVTTLNTPESRREDDNHISTRFTAFDVTIADNNAHTQNIQSLTCGQHDFQILDESAIDNHWVKLKLCKIKQVTPEGVVEFESYFEPSYINGRHSDMIQKILREALNLVTHRANMLAERIIQSGHATSEIGDFLLLQLLNKYEPILHYLYHSGAYHPEELFLHLASLHGELSTYAPKTRRTDLSLQYQHHDQASCFRELMRALRHQLTQTLKQNAIEIELQTRKHGVLVAPVNEKDLLMEASFILAARTNIDPETLRKQLPPKLKVGPVEKIRNLVNLQLPGIRCRALSVAPRQVPYHGDYCYFALDLNSTDRAQLAQSGGFAFHIAGEYSDLSLQFWAIRNS
ncbi:type VI secretion system baseplate subunit TssK [Photobacterium lipolyticum]|uniref:Type VI secretion system baseplate subunit TssK n=1 Tax=Photobacterium lipolyticum TaxID=266810 RepID=A0A2T3MYN4_9GAMM|nr:type VI secretion system baseplate subunit TssK [Photobacterium lipolyticum]PSW05097.1 type VI secretion system baseplate subunit TssK [Photobacterium lipolyticum]